jgi:ribosomal protein S11
VHIRLKGITRAGRRQLGRLLEAEGLMITSVEDVTPIPFNGTRLRSKRRR